MSVMTRGIISQPYSLAMHSDMSRRQFYSHAQWLLGDADSSRKHWQNESNNVQVLMAEVARLKAENEIFEEGMRSIACSLSAGGYNAETLTATQLVEKVQWGVDHLADTSGHLADQLRAEIAGLKTGYEAYERVNAELKAEVDGLRREREGKVLCDLELFETLRDSANTEADEHRQCMTTYRPLRQASLDSVVKKCDDLLAALGQGEQS